MGYQYIPQIWPLIISGIVTISLGIIVFLGQRNSKVAVIFAFSMLTVTLWSLPNAFELMASDLQTKLFWANMQYFAYCYSPLTLLALCMEVTGYDKWIKTKKFVWLAILPTIIIILVWTNSFHGLLRYDVYLKSVGGFSVITKKYGIAFYVHAFYSHTINIIALILLIKATFYNKKVYRKQTVALLIAASLIVIPNMIYILGLSPFQYDITPVFFAPAGLITMWAIFRYKLFDLVPVVRSSVIENMDIGIMVLDLQDRVLDINPALIRIIEIPKTRFYEARVEDIFNKIPEFVIACKDHNISHLEFIIDQKNYEALFSQLNNKKGKIIGRLVIFHDITEKLQAQQELIKQQWTLAGVKEKERLARDLHDNIGQLLGFINIQAQGIRQELANSGIDIVMKKLDQLIEVTRMAHKEIRDYISNVRMTLHSEQDFMCIFMKQIDVFKEQTGLMVNLNITYELAETERKPELWINILYIIKESLNNIRKHANAKNVIISFYLENNVMYIQVEDDGKGFHTKSWDCNERSGFGINIMKERAGEIGGEIRINSETGKGTKVILSIPLGEGEDNIANKFNAC